MHVFLSPLHIIDEVIETERDGGACQGHMAEPGFGLVCLQQSQFLSSLPLMFSYEFPSSTTLSGSMPKNSQEVSYSDSPLS